MSSRLSLSYEEFERLAVDLHERSLRLGDDWQLESTRSSRHAQVYLVKKSTQALPSSPDPDTTTSREEEEEAEDISDLAGDTSGLSENADVAYLDRSGSNGGGCVVESAGRCCKGVARVVCMEYHVVHSVSYQVPVLYFNATSPNGRSLSLEDTWRLLSPVLVAEETDRWRLVTQQEHPHLGRPFYHIHPCHTAAVMSQAMQCTSAATPSGEKDHGNYLVTWLSTFAPVVGLQFSIKYAQ